MLRLPETETEYRNALVDAAELGALKALAEVGAIKPYLSMREAFRKYGESVVKRWLSEGTITARQDGPNAKKRIDRVEIEAIARASNRASYIPTTELTQK